MERFQIVSPPWRRWNLWRIVCYREAKWADSDKIAMWSSQAVVGDPNEEEIDDQQLSRSGQSNRFVISSVLSCTSILMTKYPILLVILAFFSVRDSGAP